MTEPRIVPPDEAGGMLYGPGLEWWGARSDGRDLAHTAAVRGEQYAAALAVLDKATADLVYHRGMENEPPQYRTVNGWRDLDDLLDDFRTALGIVPVEQPRPDYVVADGQGNIVSRKPWPTGSDA